MQGSASDRGFVGLKKAKAKSRKNGHFYLGLDYNIAKNEEKSSKFGVKSRFSESKPNWILKRTNFDGE
jgi:hypothetical protein